MNVVTEEMQIGAAGMLTYLRDIITNSPREAYRREDLLVILDALSQDPELIGEPGRKIWEMD